MNLHSKAGDNFEIAFAFSNSFVPWRPDDPNMDGQMVGYQ